MSEEEVGTVNYRDEVLRLVTEGKIRYTAKYVEKSSDEKVGRIYRDYLSGRKLGGNQRPQYKHTHQTAFRTDDDLGTRRRRCGLEKILKITNFLKER